MPPEPEADEGAGCARIRQDLTSAIETYRALMADVAADRTQPDLPRRVGRLNATMAELRAAVDARVWNEDLAAAFSQIPPSPPQPQPRHARPGTVVPLTRRPAWPVR